MTDQQLKKQFIAFFQNADGAFQIPGNTGGGRSVVSVCRTILNASSPMLYRTLADWDHGGMFCGASGCRPFVWMS